MRQQRQLRHEKMLCMSDQPEQPAKPASPTRKTGLSPKQQKLQAMLEKSAQKKAGAKPEHGNSAGAFNAKSSFAGKKTAFQRKAT